MSAAADEKIPEGRGDGAGMSKQKSRQGRQAKAKTPKRMRRKVNGENTDGPKRKTMSAGQIK